MRAEIYIILAVEVESSEIKVTEIEERKYCSRGTLPTELRRQTLMKIISALLTNFSGCSQPRQLDKKIDGDKSCLRKWEPRN